MRSLVEGEYLDIPTKIFLHNADRKSLGRIFFTNTIQVGVQWSVWKYKKGGTAEDVSTIFVFDSTQEAEIEGAKYQVSESEYQALYHKYGEAVFPKEKKDEEGIN
jgi:hypothetical protein